MTLYFSRTNGDPKNTLYKFPGGVENVLKYDYMPAHVKDIWGVDYSRAGNADNPFVEADCVVIDIDSGQTIAEFQAKAKQFTYVLITSRSHQKAKKKDTPCDRFHVFFPIEKTTDKKTYLEKLKYYVEYFNTDSSCIDYKRFYYASPKEALVIKHDAERVPDFSEFAPEQDEIKKEYLEPDEVTENRNSALKAYAGHIKNEVESEEELLDRLLEFNEKKIKPPLSHKEIISTIFASTKKEIRKEKEKLINEMSEAEKDIKSSPVKKSFKEEFSDEGNALLFADKYKNRLLYCPDFKKWLVYNGVKWVGETEHPAGGIGALIYLFFAEKRKQYKDEWKKIKKEVAGAALKLRILNRCKAAVTWYERCTDAARHGALEKMARSLMMVSADMFDKNNNLINFTNGTYNIETAEFKDHDPVDMITKCANIKYTKDLKATAEAGSMTSDLMTKITCGDKDKEAFLWRILGYGLLGKNPEKLLFFFVGKGSNGKTTLMQIVSKLLGDYVIEPGDHTFCDNKYSAERTNDLADIRGSRYVIGGEVKAGAKLNMTLLKRITGGERISAKRLYENNIYFYPQCNMYFYSNDFPKASDNTEGSTNRFCSIKFNYVFPKPSESKETISNFWEKLIEKEGDYFMSRLIAGLEEYKKLGIAEPQCIKDETVEFKNELSNINMFMQLCTKKSEDQNSKASVKDLFSAYKNYCDKCGERYESISMFSRFLLRAGYESKHTNKGNFYIGLEIVEKNEDELEGETW